MQSLENGNKLVFIRYLFILMFFLLWEILAGGIFPGFQPLDPIYTSSPSKIVSALITDFPVLISDTWITVQSAIYGFILGVVTGAAIGYLFARIPSVGFLFEPFFTAINALPRPAMAPLLIIWFGLGPTSKIVLSWSIVFFLVFYNTYAGVRSIDRDLIRSMKYMGANDSHIFRMVVLPSIVSWIFAALRTGITFSLLGVIVGEFAGSTSGLGYRMMVARGLLQTDQLFAILVILVIIGVIFTEGSRKLENYLLRWRPEPQH